MVLILDGEQELRNERIALWPWWLRGMFIGIVHLDFRKAFDRAPLDIFA